MKKLMVLAAVAAMAMGAKAGLTMGLNGDYKLSKEENQLLIGDYVKGYFLYTSTYNTWAETKSVDTLGDNSLYAADLQWEGSFSVKAKVKGTQEMYELVKDKSGSDFTVVIAGTKDYYSWSLGSGDIDISEYGIEEGAWDDAMYINGFGAVSNLTKTAFGNVPEPTSGLLLLLGVAGLALKRKIK